MRSASRFLNVVLFGARVESDPDVISQWGTISVSYVLNFGLVAIAVAVLFVVFGFYQPSVDPLAESFLRSFLAVTNLLTFVLTLVASLSWRMSESAIERHRAANRSDTEYRILLSLLILGSLLFLAIPFRILSVPALIVSACASSALFQILMSQRAMKSEG
jgi:hypothetical protein